MQTDNYRKFPGMAVAPAAANLCANSVHWAQSVIPIAAPVQIAARSPRDNVTEAFEHKTNHFVMGVQWHPEYAMDGLEGVVPGDRVRHNQVLRALGDAGRDGKAATIIQKHMRGYLARKKLQS